MKPSVGYVLYPTEVAFGQASCRTHNAAHASLMEATEEIRYRRSRFSTRLPVDRRYTRSHFWLQEEEEAGVWRVGFTQFAVRMLGDFVELGFEVAAGGEIAVGQVIGQVEGFKAVTNLYAVIDGVFLGMNPALEPDIVLADTDPYHRGWLYRARGGPEAEAVDVQGYVAILDAAIQKMMGDDEATEEDHG